MLLSILQTQLSLYSHHRRHLRKSFHACTSSCIARGLGSRLLEEQKRKELMIIYGEDRVATGVTAVDMREGAKTAGAPSQRMSWSEQEPGS